MSARLWTHGYDFFSPNKDLVFHLYSRKYRRAFVPEKSKRKKAIDWIHELLSGKASTSYYLGSRRTLQEYQEFCGVDFGSRIIRT